MRRARQLPRCSVADPSALSDLTELQRSHGGCHAVHRVAQERAPRDAAAAPARKWDYPGTRGREHLDPGIAGIRRDSVGFGPQSGTESGTKWDKVGLKWDSEGRAPALFDRGSEGTQADGCSRQDATLARAPPAVHRTMFRGVERIGGTLFPAAAGSPRAGPGAQSDLTELQQTDESVTRPIVLRWSERPLLVSRPHARRWTRAGDRPSSGLEAGGLPVRRS